MDEPEERPVIRPAPRRPICADCRGTGQVQRPRAMHLQSERMTGTMLVPGKCLACRGSGHAGT